MLTMPLVIQMQTERETRTHKKTVPQQKYNHTKQAQWEKKKRNNLPVSTLLIIFSSFTCSRQYKNYFTTPPCPPSPPLL